jgi:hypothetical protein
VSGLRTRTEIGTPTLHDCGGMLGRPLNTCFSFGLSQFHGHGFWLVCEVALSWDLGDVTTSLLKLLIAYHIHQGYPFNILHLGVY